MPNTLWPYIKSLARVDPYTEKADCQIIVTFSSFNPTGSHYNFTPLIAMWNISIVRVYLVYLYFISIKSIRGV